jgi:myo-inositol-1(or 4)-monophosphatase
MTTLSDPVLAVAVRAARRASSVIMDAARDLRRLPTFSREHGEIVAAANQDAQNAIVATISAAFPDHAVQGQDSGELKGAAAGSDYKWMVDPLDGSSNFIHGFPYFAVSIALANAGEPTHAAVLDPVRDELFTAVRGKGAQLNSVAIRVSACTRLEDALVGTVFPTRKSSRLHGYLPVLNALMGRCGMRRAGSCALDLAQLAAGRLDGFWVMSMRPWGLAAGALLVREAGGRVGDLSGGTEFLRTQEVIAAAPGIFSPLREAIVAARPSS